MGPGVQRTHPFRYPGVLKNLSLRSYQPDRLNYNAALRLKTVVNIVRSLTLRSRQPTIHNKATGSSVALLCTPDRCRGIKDAVATFRCTAYFCDQVRESHEAWWARQ